MAREMTPEAATTANAPAEEPEELIDLVIAAHAARQTRASETPTRINGVVIGQLIELAANGCVRVDWSLCPISGGQTAHAMTALSESDIGRPVAIMFDGGDPAKPLVMGVVFQGEHATSIEREVNVSPDGTRVNVDGERLIFSAQKEIVLQCGEASITLTRAGKVILRGAYVSSRSTGVNRIQGGSVEIN